MNYVYVLTGWEGSAVDSRVLRDAITRPNGLKIPTGSYYLCDGGYTNANGFLAPYRSVRYHLQEWDGASSGPQNSQEYFNLKHAKARYLGVLEQLMLQALPGTDLKVEPHINSKIYVWRKNYASLSTIVSRSGFGWNDNTHTIKVDNDQIWENYVKTDSNARTMHYKPWPLYKDWCEIFGKDRAMGEHVEAFADVVQDLLHKSQESLYASNDNEYDPFTYLNEESEAAPNDMSIHGEGPVQVQKSQVRVKVKKERLLIHLMIVS
ncbi:hypothetical protein C2S53_000099 [Perilla frutescens var. hirtella]|uniref:Myb/SANT-like domain-containing protein n=1 Tax=Perilla frutescens var. hirtella TaxID=608512 RepID=A0AAD4P228_PERFH|nr:hypothetical protein C2S53_000099 [Perilla frutescens var. hirtella]